MVKCYIRLHELDMIEDHHNIFQLSIQGNVFIHPEEVWSFEKKTVDHHSDEIKKLKRFLEFVYISRIHYFHHHLRVPVHKCFVMFNNEA